MCVQVCVCVCVCAGVCVCACVCRCVRVCVCVHICVHASGHICVCTGGACAGVQTEGSHENITYHNKAPLP